MAYRVAARERSPVGVRDSRRGSPAGTGCRHPSVVWTDSPTDENRLRRNEGDLPANNRDGAQLHAGKERAAPAQHDRILRWELGPSKEGETLPFFGHERPNGGDN